MFGKKKVKIRNEKNRTIVDYTVAKNDNYFEDFIGELSVNEWVIMIDTNFVPNHAQYMVDEWIDDLREWLDKEGLSYKLSRSIRQSTSIMGSLAKLGRKGEDYQYKIVFTLPPKLLSDLIEKYDAIHMIHHMGIGLKSDSVYEDFPAGLIDSNNILEYIDTDLYHHKELKHLTVISKSQSSEAIQAIVDKISQY